ncbi:LOW QUALITY PROTEIN: hypothetical protein PanWU01x14_106830 [Parasponia andersonii]|uniref:Transmembrane protein n=1 Tax=Parasponia andersonii TaxID=3476 RepID=A0A2P5D0W3_PARAD|nr:LOW QUALITY PROTEIN: hypothetical protein PanWU01x14_106830 [Parasponia andersonii]
MSSLFFHIEKGFLPENLTTSYAVPILLILLPLLLTLFALINFTLYLLFAFTFITIFIILIFVLLLLLLHLRSFFLGFCSLLLDNSGFTCSSKASNHRISAWR